MEQLVVRQLGRTEYEPVWRAMRAFTDARTPATADELWLTEHQPVYTQGQAGKPEHVLAPGAIAVVQTDRGGQVTYHGPGQLVAYPLLDLKRAGLGPRSLVQMLENVCLELLSNFGVSGELQAGAPGVYVAGAKIASLGLRVRRGASYHGLALNVAMDLAPFQGINPCGYNGLSVTQLTHFSPAAQVPACGDAFAQLLARALQRELRPAAPHTEVV